MAASTARPASGRYISRSAMIVPEITRRFDAGRSVRNANAAKNPTARLRRAIATLMPATATTASTMSQSADVRASGICPYE